MADNERTITIKLETKQAEQNTDKLGGKIKKTKEEAQGFKSVLTKGGGGLSNYAAGLLKIIGPLAALTAGFKLAKSAISSNIELTVALDKATAGLSAVFEQITGDIGKWIQSLSESNEEQSLVSKGVDFMANTLTSFMGSLGVVNSDLLAYAERLKDADQAGRELAETQFLLKEQTLINRIEIAAARQEVEKLRLVARDVNATDKERLEAQAAAIEQIKILRKEREDELALRQLEIDAMVKAANGSAALYEARLKQHELDRDRVELQTSLIMLENRLTTRLETLTNKYVTQLNAQSNLTEEVERFDMSIFDSNLIIQQRNEVLVTQNEITAEATAKVNDQTLAVEENTEAQDGYNVTLQGSYNILARMVNLFKNFNFSSLMSLLFSGLQIAGNFVSGGATSFIGKFLGFRDGGIVQGPSHERGGVKFNVGGVVNELEGGEGVINKRSMSLPWVKSLASQLNQVGGGVKFAQGGIVQNQTAVEAQTARFEQLLRQRETVAIVEDIQKGINTVNIQNNISTI